MFEKAVAVAGEKHAGGERVDYMAQFVGRFGHQRIGGCDIGVGLARYHGAEIEQEGFQRVFGKNHQRAFGR